MARAVYFAATFGGIPLLISSIETERGRDVVVQSPAQGDTHVLTDQGRRLRRVSAEILFVDQPGQSSYLDRYDAFVALFEDGKAHVLSHPVEREQFLARGENLTGSADAGALEVRVSAVFLRDEGSAAVSVPSAGVNPTAGLDAIATAAARTKAELAAIDLSSTVPDDVLATVTAWDEAGDELDSQSVFLEVASKVREIDTEIQALQLKADLDNWQAYREMIVLRYELTRAASSFTSAARTVFDLYVDAPRPLLAICAEVYGASLARDLAEQVAKINRIRTPARIPPGTTLKMPSAGSS